MSLEFNTRVDYVYQGGDAVFSIPFSYINKSYIVIILNEDIENPLTDITWLTENQIRIESEINTGDTISIRRVTPIDDKLVTFTDNNILDGDTQNLAQEQVFNVVQEIKDNQDDLNSNMSEFVNLKNTIDHNLEVISEASELVKDAYDAVEDTQELVQGISQTYEDMKTQVEQGLPVNVMQNLFTLTFTDKRLTGKELEGLGVQGGSYSVKDFPDAYKTLATEYLEGESKIFQSEDAVTLVKSYTGDKTGQFYLPNNQELEQNSVIYSNGQCDTQLGTITEYNEITAYKYDGFYTVAADLSIGTEVYSDKLLTSYIGTIEDKQVFNIDEYNLSKTGKVYKSVDILLSEGNLLYKDVACNEIAGKITYLGEIKVDKYFINHQDYDCFYVPKDTVITIGTEIFADASLTTSLGKIGTKGIYKSDDYYYYKSRVMMNLNNSGGTKVIAASVTKTYVYYYTKKKVDSSYQQAYCDKNCTKEASFTVASIGGGTWLLVGKNNQYATLGCSPNTLVKTVSGDITYEYITLADDMEKTKYEYYKQAVVTTSVLSLDDGSYEAYDYINTFNEEFIKISDGLYRTYTKLDEVSSITVKVDSGELEEVIYNGLTTSTGVVFEYKEHSNGHKIVDGKYVIAYHSLNPNEFYLLDTEKERFTLPIIDLNKYIYFCVGNTRVNKADIGTITHNEFYEEFAKCIKHDDMSVLDDMSELVINQSLLIQSQGEALEKYNKIIEEATQISENTLKEF